MCSINEETVKHLIPEVKLPAKVNLGWTPSVYVPPIKEKPHHFQFRSWQEAEKDTVPMKIVEWESGSHTEKKNTNQQTKMKADILKERRESEETKSKFEQNKLRAANIVEEVMSR